MPDNSFPHNRILARENASFTCDLCNLLSIGLPCAAYPRVYNLRWRSFGLLHDQCSPPSACILNFHYSSKLGQSHFLGCGDFGIAELLLLKRRPLLTRSHTRYASWRESQMMRSFLTLLQREARLQSVRRRAEQKMRKMRCRGFNLRRVGDSAGRRVYLDPSSPGEGVCDRTIAQESISDA